MSALFLLARIVLGGLFVWASLDKIAHPAAMAEIIYNYQILPDALVNLSALFLPWVELLCGLSLVFGVLARGAALILTVLLLVFMLALGYNLYRGLEVACGCFSTSGDGGGMRLDLWRDAGMLVMAGLAQWGLWRK